MVGCACEGQGSLSLPVGAVFVCTPTHTRDRMLVCAEGWGGGGVHDGQPASQPAASLSGVQLVDVMWVHPGWGRWAAAVSGSTRGDRGERAEMAEKCVDQWEVRWLFDKAGWWASWRFLSLLPSVCWHIQTWDSTDRQIASWMDGWMDAIGDFVPLTVGQSVLIVLLSTTCSSSTLLTPSRCMSCHSLSH